MPLPQKVIEQLGREPVHTPGWAGKLLMFSSTIFFIALGAYLALAYGYQPYLAGKVQGLNERIEALDQEISGDDKVSITLFYSQLTNLKKLLGEHVFVSRLFDWLEANTHVNVTWGGFNFRRTEGEVSLTGIAKSIGDFIEQVQHVQQSPEVKRVTFRSLVLDPSGSWNFDLAVVFDPAFLTNPQLSAPPEGVSVGGEETPAAEEAATAPEAPQQ